MDSLIIFGAKYLIVVPVLVALYLAYRLDKTERMRFILLVILGGILSFALAKVATHLVTSPRPFVADGVTPLVSSAHDNGFPSDHTLLAAFLAYACLLFSRKLGIALLVIAILVAASRVLAGVHHGIDVIGSFGVALIGTAIAYLIVHFVFQKRTADTTQ